MNNNYQSTALHATTQPPTVISSGGLFMQPANPVLPLNHHPSGPIAQDTLPSFSYPNGPILNNGPPPMINHTPYPNFNNLNNYHGQPPYNPTHIISL